MPFAKPRFMRLFQAKTVGYGHIERDGDGNVTRAEFAQALDCHDESCEHANGGKNGKHKKDYPRGYRMMITSMWFLFVLAVVYLVASYGAQFHYLVLARHQPVIAYGLAGAMDVTMMVFILSALSLAMQGEGAARAHFGAGIFAFLSVSMNYAASEALPLWDRLAYVAPPVALWVIAGFQAWALRKFILKVEGEIIPTWRRIAYFAIAAFAFSMDPVTRFLAYRRWAINSTDPGRVRLFTVQPAGVITLPEVDVKTVPEIEQPPTPPEPKQRRAADDAKRDRLMAAVALANPRWLQLDDSERSNLAYTVAKEHETETSDDGSKLWPHHTSARRIVEREWQHAMSNGNGDHR